MYYVTQRYRDKDAASSPGQLRRAEAGRVRRTDSLMVLQLDCIHIGRTRCNDARSAGRLAQVATEAAVKPVDSVLWAASLGSATEMILVSSIL